jgi:hypothetical protein
VTYSSAILSTVTLKAGFARFTAIMLLAALLSPTFFFGDFGRVSAKSGRMAHRSRSGPRTSLPRPNTTSPAEARPFRRRSNMTPPAAILHLIQLSGNWESL